MILPQFSLTPSAAPHHVYPKGCAFHSLDDIQGRRITVMGLGLNGGGEAAVRFFLKHGAFVTATDMKSPEALRPTIDSLNGNPPIDSSLMPSRLMYRLGEHVIDDFVNADCVIKNPAVKFEGNTFLEAASKAGVAIESDISCFLALSAAPVIAVTGSKGKSSTVSALHWILASAGFPAFLGGNITVSPLTFLEKTSPSTPVVLELSSWQLADLRGRGLLRPRISIITKIVSDHQNWYGNMASYVDDKRLVYACQGAGDFAIFDGEGDPSETAPEDGGSWGDLFAKEAEKQGVTVLRYAHSRLPEGVSGAWTEDGRGIARLPPLSPRLASGAQGRTQEQVVMDDLLVPGTHVRTNALNAALAALIWGVRGKDIRRALSQWQGIEHRLQFFHEWHYLDRGGVGSITARFYDDSCSTVAEAACAASASFDTPVILIAGGTDKGLSQEPLAKCIKDGTASGNIYAVYLLQGSATDRLTALLDGGSYRGPFATLEELLRALKDEVLRRGSPRGAQSIPVVFSPGATSFGMFANEFDRGDKFQAAVRALF